MPSVFGCIDPPAWASDHNISVLVTPKPDISFRPQLVAALTPLEKASLVPQRPIYNGNNKRRGNTEGGSYSALRTRSLSFMKNLHVERIQFLRTTRHQSGLFRGWAAEGTTLDGFGLTVAITRGWDMKHAVNRGIPKGGMTQPRHPSIGPHDAPEAEEMILRM